MKKMKNKKWAQKEVDRYLSYEEVSVARDALVFAKGVINQLDEPEVLSQEWIDEHLFSLGDKYPWKKAVPVVDLQNLIVPKQELPVIPKHVADWMEDLKSKDIHLLDSIYDFTHGDMRKHGDVLMRAWLDGFTVEEEQKYYVLVRDEEYGGFWCLSKKNNGDISIGVNRNYSEVDWGALKLTEQEIKDYDERYWAFAVKVGELE